MRRYFFRLSVLTILLNTNLCFAQTKIDCEVLLSKKIDIESPEKFRSDVKNLLFCGLDSVDAQIFLQSPMVGEYLISVTNKETRPTYRDLINSIAEYITTSGDLKDRFIEINRIQNKLADAGTWESDKASFKKIGLTDDEIYNLHEYLLKNADKKLTYGQLAAMYHHQNDSLEAAVQEDSLKQLKSLYSQFCNTDHLILLPGNLLAFDNYEAGIKCSEKMNKTAMIYFNGYAAVNCRKMEEYVLSRMEIIGFLRKNFVVINLYVDDKTELPKDMQRKSKMSDKMITTVGVNNAELETKKYGNDTQPYFVILDKKQNQISQTGYTENDINFLQFLIDGNMRWQMSK